jgi:hypothetical protein
MGTRIQQVFHHNTPTSVSEGLQTTPSGLPHLHGSPAGQQGHHSLETQTLTAEDPQVPQTQKEVGPLLSKSQRERISSIIKKNGKKEATAIKLMINNCTIPQLTILVLLIIMCICIGVTHGAAFANNPAPAFSNNPMTQMLDTDSDHYLVFDQVGLMASSTTYTHIMLPINFSAIYEQINAVEKTIDTKFKQQQLHGNKLYNNLGYWDKVSLEDQTRRILIALLKRIKIARSKVDTINEILPQIVPQKPHRQHRDAPLPEPPLTQTDSFTHVNHPTLTRHKRWILQVLSGVVGTFMGLYTNYQLKTIANKVQDLETTQDLLIHLTKEHTDQIKKLTDTTTKIYEALISYSNLNPQIVYVEFDEVISDIEEKVDRIVNLVQQLQHRRLAIDWLSKEQLLLLHDTVLTYTQERNYALLTANPSDYFQLELSYLRNKDGVVLLLHIPCTATPDLMTIMRYIPFPIPLSSNTYHTAYSVEQSLSSHQNPHFDPKLHIINETLTKREALYLVAEADLIAINGNSRYRLLTQSDFAACIQRNHIYLCDKQQILGTNLLQTCLGSLYHKDPNGVKTNCKFERRPLREEIFQISTNEFLVFSPVPYVSRVHCNNGTSFTADFGQTTRLQIPNGCGITLKSHELAVEESIQVPLPASVTTWRWDPLSLPADLLQNLPHLDSTLYNLSQTVDSLIKDNSSRDAVSKLSTRLATLQTRLHHPDISTDDLDHHIISSGSKATIFFWFTLIISSLALIIGGIYLYRQFLMAKLLKTLPVLQAYLPTAPATNPHFTDRELDSLGPIFRPPDSNLITSPGLPQPAPRL